MKTSTLKAKINRNNLVENARKYFVDETSEIVKELNLQGKKALFGIQNKKGIYTIIGEEFVYYSTSSRKISKISLKQFSDELHENGCKIGKGYFKFKFLYNNIVLSNKDKVWLKNANTMFSIWNTILCLEKKPSSKID